MNAKEPWVDKFEVEFQGYFCDDCANDVPHEIAKCHADSATNFYWMRKQLTLFIRETIKAELTSLLEEIEKTKLIEAATNAGSLMWKQRINNKVDQIADFIRSRLSL